MVISKIILQGIGRIRIIIVIIMKGWIRRIVIRIKDKEVLMNLRRKIIMIVIVCIIRIN